MPSLRLIEAVEKIPRSIAVVHDNSLLGLAQHLGSANDPSTRDVVLGELLYRRWLYVRNCPQELAQEMDRLLSEAEQQFFEQEVAVPRMAAVESDNPPPAPPDCGTNGFTGGRAWQHFFQRAIPTLEADGLVACASADGMQAVLLPFRLRNCDPDGSIIRDSRGQEISAWADQATVLEGARDGKKLAIQLSVETGDFGDHLEGDSFALPVLIAEARQAGQIPELKPLSVLGSGRIADGCIAPVGAIKVKRELAARIGARLFVAPEIAADRGVLPLTPGRSVGEAMADIRRACEDAGLGQLSPEAAMAGLSRLVTEVRLGAVALEHATPRLGNYEATLSNAKDESRVVTESLLRAQLLRAAIANHSGRPSEAAEMLSRARQQWERHPVLYIDARALMVVSLTDRGCLEEAEAMGRELLQEVRELPPGVSTEDRVRCEMVAHGVLGAQPLLHKSLLDQTSATESLCLIQQALKRAKELGDHSEICRDAVQIALWHALLCPERTQDAVDEAATILTRSPVEERGASEVYLLRTRFLGAYRALLLDKRVPSDFNDWPLPPDDSTCPMWPRATALKYRGTLRAAAGDRTGAENDFRVACDLLAAEIGPLLRFFGATTALQAAESLGADAPGGGDLFALRALAVFDECREWFSGKLSASRWSARARCLTAPAERTNAVETPQLYFAY